MINYNTFQQIELRAGKILSAEKVEGSEKLLKLSVDFAEEQPRQIISGISKQFPELEKLIGRTVMFVTNLEPRMIMGLQSNGMILAVSTEAGGFSLLEPNDTIPPGTKAK